MQAIPPASYFMPNGKLIFPRDADAGGSWIAMHENGNAAVLLNGAFEKHISNPPYRKSRGVIFIKMLSVKKPVENLQLMDLKGIEPFTIIVLDNNILFECTWDGKICCCKQLEKEKPHIWSSVTLYEKEIVEKRERWFAQFLHQHPVPNRDEILHFHRFAGDEDAANNLKMNRNGVYSTVSVTAMAVYQNKGSMKYLDLKNGEEYETQIKFVTATEIMPV